MVPEQHDSAPQHQQPLEPAQNFPTDPVIVKRPMSVWEKVGIGIGIACGVMGFVFVGFVVFLLIALQNSNSK